MALPDLGAAAVKAKVDTGARSSSLHAYDVEILDRGDGARVRFTIHPRQRSVDDGVVAVAELIDQRWVRSSSGHRELRPVVRTTISLAGRSWEIELTLTNRDEMGFRMLLGREAVRDRFVVDPGRSFVAGPGPRVKKKSVRAKRPKTARKTAPARGRRTAKTRSTPFDEE